VTPAALKWGERTGRWRRVERGVYVVGAAPVEDLDRARARVRARGGVARGLLAGVLHDLDAVSLDGPCGRRRPIDHAAVVVLGGVRCANGLDTLVDLAEVLDDDRWEQALESALRRRLTSVGDIEAVVPELGRARVRGCSRIRRVLAVRPEGAPPTESMLETRMVQLARRVPGLEAPARQVVVNDGDCLFVARVDLAWPNLGLFLELDGQQHADQPLYDARRETAVVAATGWLCGRFTWHEVVRVPTTTARRLGALVAQAKRRPVTPLAR
jgi:hypothetical protein